MVSHIVKNRRTNQIQIGINPYTEWQDLFESIRPYKKWAGDIKKWDGSMLPQVQHAIYEVMKEKYKGKPKYLAFVMGFVTYCPVIINDDIYLTTHSMPSGSWITAVFNSMVNRFYTAMWFYREITKASSKPTVSQFLRVVIDNVFGDDKLNAVRGDYDMLNAITMRDFFQSIGMDFTDAVKKPIDTPYQEIEDISFLKRKFVYHPRIAEITCPLDLNTIFSSISWYDSKKDLSVVLMDKVSAFQREIYLHYDIYHECVDKLRKAMEEKGLSMHILPPPYLLSLYKSQNYNYMDDLYGIKLGVSLDGE